MTDFGFGSETTGLEYGILGNMTVDSNVTKSTPPTTNYDLQSLFPFNAPTATTPTSPLPQSIMQHQQQQYSPPIQLANTMKRDSTSSASSNNTLTKVNANSRRKGNNGNTPEAVYNSVRRPFNYAEGFHYLIQYVTDK